MTYHSFNAVDGNNINYSAFYKMRSCNSHDYYIQRRQQLILLNDFSDRICHDNLTNSEISASRILCLGTFIDNFLKV